MPATYLDFDTLCQQITGNRCDTNTQSSRANLWSLHSLHFALPLLCLCPQPISSMNMCLALHHLSGSMQQAGRGGPTNKIISRALKAQPQFDVHLRLRRSAASRRTKDLTPWLMAMTFIWHCNYVSNCLQLCLLEEWRLKICAHQLHWDRGCCSIAVCSDGWKCMKSTWIDIYRRRRAVSSASDLPMIKRTQKSLCYLVSRRTKAPTKNWFLKLFHPIDLPIYLGSD